MSGSGLKYGWQAWGSQSVKRLRKPEDARRSDEVSLSTYAAARCGETLKGQETSREELSVRCRHPRGALQHQAAARRLDIL
jgi:hypothetical protein